MSSYWVFIQYTKPTGKVFKQKHPIITSPLCSSQPALDPPPCSCLLIPRGGSGPPRVRTWSIPAPQFPAFRGLVFILPLKNKKLHSFLCWSTIHENFMKKVHGRSIETSSSEKVLSFLCVIERLGCAQGHLPSKSGSKASLS